MLTREETRHAFPIHAPNTIGNYALKFIPRKVWAAARRRAAKEGVSIRWVLLSALQAYADGGTVVTESSGEVQ
jgi:hypothetical protein